jgi:hypothetical protein
MSNYFINTNTKQITFSDNRFYTTGDGNHVPSVTTILQAYPKDAHFFKWLKEVGDDADTIRDEAGRRGSIVHKLTEEYDAGLEINLLNTDGNIGYKLAEWSMFERYVQFRKSHEFDVLLSEVNIVDPKLGYAGTIDRVIRYNGKNILVDIKTSNAIHDQYWLQLAAYNELYKKNIKGKGQQIDNVAILWLNAKTRTDKQFQGIGWQLVFRDNAERANDLDLFKATQNLWKAQNKTLQPKSLQYNLSHKL